MSESEKVLMPKELTAANGAKAALMGEFHEQVEVDCPDCLGSGSDEDGDDCDWCCSAGTLTRQVPVSWDTIKEIYRKAVEVCAAPQGEGK